MTPNKLRKILEGAEALIESMHLSCIKILVKRMGIRLKEFADKLLGGADKNLIETLNQSGMLMEDIEKEIAKQTGAIQEEIREEIKKIGAESFKVDPAVYEAVGLPKEAVETNLSPETIRIMERNYDTTNGAMQNLSRTTAEATNRIFIEETDKAIVAMQTNNMSLDEAFVQACMNIDQQGISYITYNNGKARRESVEVAVLRALRTSMAQTSAQIVLNRAKELGHDIISVSAHLGARTANIPGKPYADHSSWQGKLYSLSGTDKDLPSFYPVTGFGTGEGLCGWNCRHTIGLGIKGYPPRPVDDEESKKRYDLEQKQRSLERAIRKTKKSYVIWEEALEQAPNSPEIIKRYNEVRDRLKEQNEQYREFCKYNNLKPREMRLFTV